MFCLKTTFLYFDQFCGGVLDSFVWELKLCMRYQLMTFASLNLHYVMDNCGSNCGSLVDREGIKFLFSVVCLIDIPALLKSLRSSSCLGDVF